MSDRRRGLEALLRGDVYRALALGFDYPTRESAECLEELLRDLHTVSRGAVDVEIPAALEPLAAAWSPERAQDLASQHHASFDTQGAIGYCESAYRRVDRGSLQRDVTGFYHAFGFAATAGQGQPDSIRHELGFMAFLAYKEWFALEQGWTERVEITRGAEVSFLGEHLGSWAGAFAEHLSAAAAGSVYECLALALGQWIVHECRYLGVTPLVHRVPSPDAQPDPLCGGCPATPAG